MSARALGPGKLRAVVDSDGRTAFQLDYVTASGKRSRAIVGHDARTAERVRRNVISNRDLEVQGLGGERGLDLPVAQVIERYLAGLVLRKSSPRVLIESTSALHRIVGDLGVRLLRDVTKAKVADWRARRAEAGAANKTINNGVALLAAALNYAVELDQIAASPLAGLKALPVTDKHRRRRPRALTEDELEALLCAAAKCDAKRPDLVPRRPLLLFLIATGARWSEAVSTRWLDFDARDCAMTLRSTTTKTQKTRTIPLHSSVVEALTNLRASEAAKLGRAPRRDAPVFRSPEGATWTSEGRWNFRRYLRVLMREAKIEYRDATGRVVHTHALRHSFATMLARAKVPISTAKALTGHSTTALLLDVYTHVSTEDARAAINSLPALGSSKAADK